MRAPRSPLWRLSATALVQGYREGRFTPLQALHDCLARAEQVQPPLNAVVAWDREGARQAAEASTARWRRGEPLGPLDGVPVSVKDNLHAQGLPTRCGSLALRGGVPVHDELPVARLRAAGALLFCKTNVPEFAMQGYTDNLAFGATGNPWNPALTPGGSSGGAVALLAAGAGPLALGTDGGGSIRRPASHTGCVGFKPGSGRVARGGGLPPLFLDHEVAGPLARTAEDLVRAMQVLGDGGFARVAQEPPRPLRILQVKRFGRHPVDPRIDAGTAAAAAQLAALGHRVSSVDSLELFEAVNAGWPLLSQVGLAWLAQRPDALDAERLGASAQAALQDGRAAPATALFELLVAVHELRAALGPLFAAHDLLLTPAAAALPWPKAESHPPLIDGQPVGPRGHAVFTGFANAAGLPALALPCGFADTADGPLPMGVQLVAATGGDELLLALARQVERHAPWHRGDGEDRFPLEPS